MNILIIEDEIKLATLLADYLRQAMYQVTMVHDGNEALEVFQSVQPDLVLLDLMLPGKDGLTICREIRQQSDVPVVMVTAKVEEIDRLLGLELGADDYICKPFSPREVVARVKAILRRVERLQQPQAAAEETSLQLNVDKLQASICGQPLDLTAIEFQLLQTLSQEPGRVFSRDQLMDYIYRDHRVVSDRTVDSHVKKLRKKMSEAAPHQEWIYSVYGVGYKYEGD
ncbi:response regulator [Bacterioplanoides sp.]|uniref:response regulator n=1 Tax=Bacterioplanoides sp. TaxID=2066072 RepID=UPI003B009556